MPKKLDSLLRWLLLWFRFKAFRAAILVASHQSSLNSLNLTYPKYSGSTVEFANLTSEKRIALKPIGFVRTEAVGDEVKEKSRISWIVVNSELTEALEGIAEFSHLFVLFWLHEVTSEEQKTLKVHPRGREDLPLLGVFATRTKLRPNPIGLTLVELLRVEGNVLTVRGLDAFDKTPVLDLKPFDFWDMARDAKVPRWWIKLEKEKAQKP